MDTYIVRTRTDFGTIDEFITANGWRYDENSNLIFTDERNVDIVSYPHGAFTKVSKQVD